jgi:hypothetical protein
MSLLNCKELLIDEHEFLRHFEQHSSQLMWFLGAGAPRSSGLPTALDIIWDLKRRYYCVEENQDVQAHNVSNSSIRSKIQGYVESKGFPKEWSPDEYSFYFELMFGDDYGAQRSYLQDQMSMDRVTLSIGERALAALLAMDRARLVFTTNFDAVVETAYAAVAGKELDVFHLEGSYAALDALNGERFPIYAKLHGDFRYRSIKNLSSDLLENDAELQKCFVAAAGRYGLIVAGYSGRDANVMGMLGQALSQPNPFPQGIWWTTSTADGVAPVVATFIESARAKGVAAHVVETGPFDVMLLKMWRHLADKPRELDEKVRSAQANPVSIPLAKPGTKYPVLRTNALEVLSVPSACGRFPTNGATAADFFDAAREKRSNHVVSYFGGPVFWGDSRQVAADFEGILTGQASLLELQTPISDIASSTHLHSFFEHGIARAVCCEKPLLLRKKGSAYYAVVDPHHHDDARLTPLKNALGGRADGSLCGYVPGLVNTFWDEAVRLKLDERGGVLWLLLEPDVWITPLRQRDDAKEFLRVRRLKRYNNKAYEILNAWIEILLGAVGQGRSVTVSYAPTSDYPAAFAISTRSGFSGRGGQ